MRIKKTLFLFIILGSANFSCGILGFYSDNVNWNPDYQAKLYAEINNSLIAQQMDSLIRQIDSAKNSIPSDLSETILVVETFDDYSDFLKIWEHKFNTPKDTKTERRKFKKYQKQKTALLKNPKYTTVYLDKKVYETKEIDKYRYVLKTIVRLNYDPNNITIDNNGFVAPYIGILTYYIYDRKTNKVFNEIKELNILTKRK